MSVADKQYRLERTKVAKPSDGGIEMFMSPDVKVYLSTAVTDMRKSFDGLAQLVKQDMCLF